MKYTLIQYLSIILSSIVDFKFHTNFQRSSVHSTQIDYLSNNMLLLNYFNCISLNIHVSIVRHSGIVSYCVWNKWMLKVMFIGELTSKVLYTCPIVMKPILTIVSHYYLSSLSLSWHLDMIPVVGSTFKVLYFERIPQ